MAWWMGWPVARFQTSVVSRWLVMPMARMSLACSRAWASAARAVASWVLDPAGLGKDLRQLQL